MNEKNKNILSYVISILIVGSITTCFIIAPYDSLLGLFWIFLTAIGLALLLSIIKLVKDIVYEFFSSNLFQSIYRKYVTKCYESKKQLLFERGKEICTKCGEDCVVKHPLRIYSRYDTTCNKSADIFIKEHKLTVNEF